MRGTALTRNYENVNKRRYQGTGLYDIPVLTPENYEKCRFVGFNYASSCKNREETGIHFYLDDYQFQRLWNMPDYYLPMLKQFKCVMTPDFSTYTDYPLALQIYNHYRKHWIGAYLQENGIKVIPTISWSDEESYTWCFDGEPVHGVVSISSVGTQMNKRAKELFLKGFQEMIIRLKPETILFYGPVPAECVYGGSIVQLPAFQKKFLKDQS